MLDDISKTIFPVIVALLIIWLIYRIKRGIRQTVRNEIYNNFPPLKDSVNNLEQKVEHLKSQIEVLETKIKEFDK